MMEYSRKQRVEAFMLPSQGSNHKRFMFSIRCWNRARGFGICCFRKLQYMLQALQPKCPQMFVQPLRKLYQKKGRLQGTPLQTGLKHYKEPVDTMLKHGPELCLIVGNSYCHIWPFWWKMESKRVSFWIRCVKLDFFISELWNEYSDLIHSHFTNR